MPHRPSRFAASRRLAFGLVAVWWLLACLLATRGLAGEAAPSTPPAAASGILLDVRGAIGPATTEYLRRGLERAETEGAGFVILRIDTPGGLATSMRDINRDLLASRLPVIAYVAPGGAQAASAGTYILYATHLAAMAPGTNLGAATPVQMGGAPPADPKAGDDEKPAADPGSNKALNDAVAYIRSLADLYGRNADWAEEAVREAASLPAREALEQGVVEIVATSVADLLAQADGRTVRVAGEEITLNTAGAQVTEHAPDWRSQLLASLTNPNLAYILLLIGMYGIIFELMNPGAIFPGVLGGTALLLALFALNMLPISYAGMALLVLGVALLTAEAFVASFGVLGIGGVIAFGIGSLLLFDGNVPGFALSLPVIGISVIATLLLLTIVLAAAVRAHRREVTSGDSALLRSHGRVVSWHEGRGMVEAHGETWQARGSAPLKPGDTVRITARQGLVLTVEPTAPPS